MNRDRMTSVVAGVALLLGCAPLTVIYSGLFEWFIPVALVTAAVIGTSIGLRSLRANVLLQVAGMFGTLLLLTTWMFRSGSEFGGVLPSPATFGHFESLISTAGNDIRRLTVPVESTEGLVFLAFLAVGSLAIMSEVFVSVLRTPSLVGLCTLVIYLVPALILPHSLPWMLFVPGALGYLWLLLSDNINRVRNYGRRFSGNGRGIDRWEPSPLASTGRWMAIVIVPLALLLPSALPGVNTGLLDSWINDASGEGGTANRVNPWAELEGSLGSRDSTELGIVETDSDSPGYMKMWSASLLREKGFEADTRLSEQAVDVTSGIPNEPVPDEVETNESSATFRATGLEDSALPLFGDVTTIDVDDQWSFDPIADTVTSDSTTTKDMTFRYSYRSTNPTPDQLRELGNNSQSTPEYRANSATRDVPEITERVETLTEGATNAYDKTMAIFDYFSEENGFVYDLSTEVGQSHEGIENFLENKRGYCQQYAAAMAWMVRDAGVPARVAIGLTEGQRVSDGYRLTNFDFHAWVEVYFDDFGWVPFDPTPSAGMNTPAEFEWAPDPDRPDNETGGGDDDSNTDDQNGDDNSDDSNSDSDSNQGDSGADDQDSATGAVMQGREPPMVWPYWVGAATTVALALLAPALSRWWRRRRMTRATSDTATRTWDEFCDSLRDLRIGVTPAETPRAVAHRVTIKDQLPASAVTGVWHLASAAEQDRYARSPATDLQLLGALRAARYGISSQQPAWTQLRADVLPPSVLARWGHRMSTGFSRAGHAVIRVRLGAGRFVRRILRKRRR